MSGHLTCTDEPHIHTTVWPQAFHVPARTPLLLIDGTVMAIIPSIALAERVAQLLCEHGLVTVRDDLAPTFPAPRLPPTPDLDPQPGRTTQ